jgi:4-amino-4-deoxy-L-arabinose transferase-like glycosyltransferase
MPAILVLVDVVAGTPVSGTRRPVPWRLVAGATALAMCVVFMVSVVWYFANFDGSMPRHGFWVQLGADAYGLAMLALLPLLPIRHLTDRVADRRRAPARISVGTAPPD